MKQYGGADLGDRTLIDALQPALEALQKKDLQAAAQAAQQGAEATAKMVKAGAGRSSYVNKENLDGVMDPGRWLSRKSLRHWLGSRKSPVALRLPGLQKRTLAG